MPIAVPEQLMAPSGRRAVAEQLTWMAETFADAIAPVWIHDAAGACVYANALAETRNPAFDVMTFDLFDHTGCLLGRMRTVDV